jgi:prepilin-type N-terminal cleavage/methylation domain-containing protein
MCSEQEGFMARKELSHWENGRRQWRNPNGFTLVELLVVIAIVGVLLAILLPSLSEAKYKAREIQCEANLKFLMLGSLAYSSDYKGSAPDGGFATYGRGCFDTDTRKLLFDNYGLNNVRLWWCPLAYFARDSATATSMRLGQNVRWFNDPTYAPSGLDWTENHRNQQGYNYFMGPSRGFSNTPSNAIYKMPIYLRFDMVRAPSTRQVWVDNIKGPGATYGGISGVWQHPCNTHDRQGLGNPEGTMNAMADGHVEFRKYYWGVNVDDWVFQYFSY